MEKEGRMKKVFGVLLFVLLFFSVGMFAACAEGENDSSEGQGAQTGEFDNADEGKQEDETLSDEHAI